MGPQMSQGAGAQAQTPPPVPPVYGERRDAPNSQNGNDQFAQQVAGHMARSASQKALQLLHMGAGEVRVYIERNHYSVHVLSFCGGVVLSVVSLLGLLNF